MKYVTKEQLAEMIQLQEVLNKKYNGADWRKAVRLGMAECAFLVEVAEMLDEVQPTWAWWKKTPKDLDWDNAHKEFIDVIHFALLLTLYRYDEAGLVETILEDDEAYEASMGGPVGDPHAAFISAVSRFLLGVQRDQRWVVIVNLKNIIETGAVLLKMEVGDVYSVYRFKNEVNHNRVDFGQTVRPQ